jgi:DsbE subfamily thiol:disulfide oxidoreductase
MKPNMTSRTVWRIISPLAVAAAALLALQSCTSSRSGQAMVGKQAPVWEVKDAQGKTFRSSDVKGKVAVVNFWATWCGPCRAEIPNLIELQKRYGPEGLVIVGISLDEEGAAVVEPFIKRLGVNYPVVIGTKAVDEAFGGVEAIPAVFVIDRDGKIVSQHEGLVAKEVLEQEIKPLLKREPGPSASLPASGR